MHDPILIELKHFLDRHWKPGKPVLLACSGGPDSKALLYLLLETQKFFDLEIQVAHIDHGWRAESRHEADKLKSEVENLGLTFHLRVLKDLPKKEGAARDGRYAELRQIAEDVGAQAIVLGHQMDDQAETVLKRVLEGAPLPTCGGMKEVSNGLWRPLLRVLKKDLEQWLEKRNISYFTDSTNLDPKYLRGRFRTTIIPQLEAAFGKSIVKNLCLLGERAQKLEAHLDEVVLEFFIKKTNPRLSREVVAKLLRMLKPPF